MEHRYQIQREKTNGVIPSGAAQFNRGIDNTPKPGQKPSSRGASQSKPVSSQIVQKVSPSDYFPYNAPPQPKPTVTAAATNLKTTISPGGFSYTANQVSQVQKPPTDYKQVMSQVSTYSYQPTSSLLTTNERVTLPSADSLYQRSALQEPLKSLTPVGYPTSSYSSLQNSNLSSKTATTGKELTEVSSVSNNSSKNGASSYGSAKHREAILQSQQYEAQEAPAKTPPLSSGRSGSSAVMTKLLRDYKPMPRGNVGLRNIGNTCFLNSVLQCVFATPVFSDYFLGQQHEKELNPKEKGVAKAFASLLKNLLSQSNGSSYFSRYSSGCSTFDLKNALGRATRHFTGYDQEDGQEFLRFLLDSLHEDLNRVSGKAKYQELKEDKRQSLQYNSDIWWNYNLMRDNSIVTDCFGGQLFSKITCCKCNNESWAFDNFMDLSLSFTRSLNILPSISLERLVEHFLKEENLEEPFHCGQCKAPQKSKKKFTLWRLPFLLVFHLKRFQLSRFRHEKLTHPVTFPKELDMSTFVKESRDESCRDCRYELFGIVNHSGSLSGGHYTAEAKNPSDGKWYSFNDDIVSEGRLRNYEEDGSSAAYLLFYAKKF